MSFSYAQIYEYFILQIDIMQKMILFDWFIVETLQATSRRQETNTLNIGLA